ncbi:MAG TPA: hypothetical protein PLQ35_15375 [bacterium]|nr:hypothetical protein [bacterium]HQL63665.1 hypothetical protein [bacterium]
MEESCGQLIPALQFASVPDGVGFGELRTRAEFLELFLGVMEKRVRRIRAGMTATAETLAPQRFSFMVRNKDGFTREEAKSLFYRFRQKKTEEPEEESRSNQPQDTDARLERIMDYMEETSKKLDRIEDDITFLKEQVADILKRL